MVFKRSCSTARVSTFYLPPAARITNSKTKNCCTSASSPKSKHNGVATLVMNRPDRLNALNTKLVMALASALRCIAKDESVRVVLLTGAGRAFCSGGDLAMIAEGRQSGEAKDLELLLGSGME